jgi:hypothetical protein
MLILGQDPIDFGTFPDRINLGCGFDHREGYLNIDLQAMHQPDLVADVTCLHALPADAYTEIVAQDILEHLPRTATRRILLHWGRLLRIGGLLQLRVPDIIGVGRLLADPANRSVAAQENLIQSLFGTQAYSGDFHQTGFTEIVIRAYLEMCGYTVNTVALTDHWLLDVTAIKSAVVHPHDIDDYSELIESTGADVDFVKRCYQQILGREADPGGLEYYVDALGASRVSRQQLIDTMVRSDEHARVGAR